MTELPDPVIKQETLTAAENQRTIRESPKPTTALSFCRFRDLLVIFHWLG
jgi:hypothetical protein